MRAAFRAALGCLILVCLAGAARATGVAVLTDSRVAQYREVLSSVREVLRDAPVHEVSTEDLSLKVNRTTPSVILAIGQRALVEAEKLRLPVVFCMVSGSPSPSRSVTGLRLEVSPESSLDAFRSVHPQARRLGVLYDARTFADYLQEAEKAAAARGLELVARPISDAREVRATLSSIDTHIDALWLLPDPQIVSAGIFDFLLLYTLERRIALFGFVESFTRLGALASMTPDYVAIGRQAARLAADVAQKPKGLPLPPMTLSPGVLSINARTARQLGLTLSADVTSKARQVYR